MNTLTRKQREIAERQDLILSTQGVTVLTNQSAMSLDWNENTYRKSFFLISAMT